MQQDKRQFPRFVPIRDVFAALGRGITRVGKVKDISKGGSSFEYIVHADIMQKTAHEIDIFIPGEEFYLADIPCRIIYDIPINKDNTFTAPFIPKRCGIQFGELTERQKQMLDYFLTSFARIPSSKTSFRSHTDTPACQPSL
ncbi:MAG: PilZ domain-containing protein [Desulfobacterota bacterium]|nr:PilZ domain-containing protein [Thermodesulfobacteriota bacterium]